jgi:hypothetical protein
MQIEWINPSKLLPYPNNTKTHPEDQVIRIAQQIKTVGWTQPIVIDSKFCVIAGHGRLLAAQHLKLNQVPITKLENLSDDQIKAYRIADNAVAESPWDVDFLKFEIGSLERVGLDLDLCGFAPDRLDALFNPSDDVDDEQAESGPRKEIPADIDFATEIDEKNDFIVLLFKNKDQMQKACEKLGIKKVKYQLSSNAANENMIQTGVGRVIDGARVLEMLE